MNNKNKYMCLYLCFIFILDHGNLYFFKLIRQFVLIFNKM